MLPLAYTESVELKDHIHKIATLREQILTIPLSPKSELKYRFEAKATRIHASLALAHHMLSRGQVVKILGSQTRHVPSEYRDVLTYADALSFIEENWTASPKSMTIPGISAIAHTMFPLIPDMVDNSIASHENAIKAMLDYLESQKDHPVIQSGIALSVLSTDGAVTEDAGVIARLVASAYLAKYGFDVRGLLTVEKNWMAQDGSYAIALRSHSTDGNLNHFLLFYAQTIEENLSERLSDLSNNKFHQDFPAGFWELNDRQKQILAILEEPTSTLTNKKAQAIFGTSQITASRDLSKLNTLGLITPHGKGRSVSYTRV